MLRLRLRSNTEGTLVPEVFFRREETREEREKEVVRENLW